jgi:hypothetical protein
MLFLFFSPSYAANFVEIARGENYIMYVDTDSIEFRNTAGNYYVVVWAKSFYREEYRSQLKRLYGSDYFCHLGCMAYNLGAKQFQSLYSSFYDSKGDVVDKSSQHFNPYAYDEIPPGTNNELVYNFVFNYVARNFKNK